MDAPRFRVDGAHDVLKDPAGHAHHFTVLVGVLEAGTLSVGSVLAIPRAAGGSWVAHVVGFEAFREQLGRTVDAASLQGRTLGVAVRGVAPPADAIGLGEAREIDREQARRLVAELRTLEPRALEHCADCRLVEEVAG
jgi:hypothetical protein